MDGFDFNDTQPIYLQIMDRICAEIVRGKRSPADKLPAVREYALEAGVNVNTIQRVYRELESNGIAEMRRGQGTFVTSNEERLIQLREEMRKRYVADFFRQMTEMGFDRTEIIQSVEEERWERE
ncbi:GntR family transcriptional regulator [Virgibacillus halophilus]|uniref:GntR family transcriptional regulator n=1 Tax=Tigheibacillus halophilus TaxID=361280 RepID=A0ABU5C1F6_9BACI|nr:GntR family transcriptional regulator [Virgibacillus halophilus]